MAGRHGRRPRVGFLVTLAALGAVGCGHAGADSGPSGSAGNENSTGGAAASGQGAGSATGAASGRSGRKSAPGPSSILRNWDTDKDGTISVTEAVAMNEALAARPSRPLAALDTDGDGKLGEQEIATLNAGLAEYSAKKAAAPQKTGKRAAKAPAIDCAAGTGTATVSWQRPSANVDDTPLKDLAGYVIRYGTSPQSLPCRAAVKDTGATTHVVERLGIGTWYFSVVAVNREGVESPASEVVSKTIEK